MTRSNMEASEISVVLTKAKLHLSLTVFECIEQQVYTEQFIAMCTAVDFPHVF